jgi:tRNA G37 N-methylase TrmD
MYRLSSTVLCHPSAHRTSSMGKDLLAKAHITKLNELTESEVPEFTSLTVDEMAVAVLQSH